MYDLHVSHVTLQQSLIVAEGVSRQPFLEVILSNCELKQCCTEAATSISVTLTSLQVMLISAGMCCCVLHVEEVTKYLIRRMLLPS